MTAFYSNNPINQLRNELLYADDLERAELLAKLPSAKKFYKNGRIVGVKLEKAISYVEANNCFQSAILNLFRGKNEESQLNIKTSIAILGEKNKIHDKILEIISTKTINSTDFQTSTIKEYVTYFSNHWSQKLLEELEAHEAPFRAILSKVENPKATEDETWIALKKLLDNQEARGISPLKEKNPNYLIQVTNTFLKIFDAAPESLKKNIADMPLFPVYSSSIDPEHVKPLNYIFFTSNINALNAISKHIEDHQLLTPGPYNSTLMHCLISGLEHLASKRGNPLACAKFILQKFPYLKTMTNIVGTTPKSYLESVIVTLTIRKNYIEQRDLINFGTLNPRSFDSNTADSFIESHEDFDIVLRQAEEVLNLLNN